jgi:membrane protein
MATGTQSRKDALAERVASARERVDAMPGAPLVREVVETERDLGGGLIAGGVAFRIFLWLVPLGLVVAALLSFWVEHDEDGLEDATQEFGIGAAAAQTAAEALEAGDRNAGLVLVFGLVMLAWFSLGAVRALILAHALAWQLKPPRIWRPFRVIATFNGLFVGYTAVSLGLAWLREQLGTISILGTALTLAATTGVALTAMWLLPRRATTPRDLLPGALLVAVGAQLIQIAVLFYFAPRLGRSEETYGALGTAATLLIWLYVISRLITGAAFLNSTLWLRKNEANAAAASNPSA